MRSRNRLVCGVGINDASYRQEIRERYIDTAGIKRSKLIWQCPYHLKWHNILIRCYSSKYQNEKTTYKGCTVCDDWLVFSNFKSWMEKQNWEGKHLDKDFLIKGNKLYSPDTCIFVDGALNCFLTLNGAVRGEYPVGVSLYKVNGKYRSGICIDGKCTHLGYYLTSLEAHLVWQKAKLKQAEVLLLRYTEDKLVSMGLSRVILNLKDDILNLKETETL